MTLRTNIHSIKLHDFRNHAATSILPSDGLTILVGPNAAGKTNVLEAITLVTSGTSFRSLTWSDVVRAGRSAASVHLDGSRGGVAVELGLEVSSSGKREHRINRAPSKRIADISGRVPTVTFVPDDLQLAKGNPEARRVALDTLGSQMSGAYAALRSEYARTVRHRNALLKNGCSPEEIYVWDAHLVEAGAAFFQHRMRLTARVGESLFPAYSELAEEESLTMYVECSFLQERGRAEEFAAMEREDVKESMRKALIKHSAAEKRRGMTLVGPHRDDLIFEIKGMPARFFSSQGQQRTVALAWKMAEVSTLRRIAGVDPVLLLDDVMSELDERRRSALLRFISEGPQTIMTTTNLSYFERAEISEALVVNVVSDG
ncbi:MAG: DNA replication/repair protein RecF [Clostridiales bacterium]|nr:DNA replication/repair protein RecF [Clostridiales bacterium]